MQRTTAVLYSTAVCSLVRPLRVGEVCGREKPPEEGVILNQLVNHGVHPLHVQKGLSAPDFQKSWPITGSLRG